jgi:D-lactate dehydrogenase
VLILFVVIRKKSIAFFEVDSTDKAEFSKLFSKYDLLFYSKPIGKVKFTDELRGVNAIVVFVHSAVNSEVIDHFANLGLIATMSTGMDHIDVGYAKGKKISVKNVVGYGKVTVAEHALALMLAVSKRLYASISRVHIDREFETDDSLEGFDLFGKTLGIVGYGHIGKHLAKVAKALGMNVLVHTRSGGKSKQFVSLNTLLKKSDIISLHVPLTKTTRHLIDSSAIRKMRDGVVIINTARGEVIDTHALLKGLKSGKISGAGLDVLENEGANLEPVALKRKDVTNSADLKVILDERKLIKMKNVIITPHNAFNSREASKRIFDVTVDNVKKFLK